MKKFKRSLALMLAAVLLLGVVFSFAGCSSSDDKNTVPQKTPEEVLQEAYQKTGEALSGKFNVDWMNTFKDVTSGTVSMKMESKDANFDISAYFDSEASKMAALSKVTAGGQNIDFGLYLNQKEVCLDLPLFFGKPYGMKLDTLEEDLKTSLLPQMMGVTYEQFMKQYQEMKETFEKLADLQKGNNLIPEMQKMAGKIAEIIKTCEITREEKTVKIGGADQKAVCISYTLTSKELTQITDLVIDLLDSQLTGYIQKLAGMSADLGDIEDMKQELENAKKELTEMLKDGDAKAVLSYNINPENGMIMSVQMGISAKHDDVTEQMNYTVELGVDPAASNAIEIHMDVTDEGAPGLEMTTRFESTEKDGKYDGKLVIAVNDGHQKKNISANVTWDRSNSRYTLSLMENDKKLAELQGTAKKDDKTITVSVDSVTGEGAAANIGKLEVSFTSGAKVPETPQYTNVVTMTMEQWQELAMRIQGIFGSSAA